MTLGQPPARVDQRIPFSRPWVVGTELERVAEALATGHLSGGGEFTARCEAWLGQQLGAPVQLTTSCTHALELAALVLGLAPGDEVIVPTFTFPSTANAFALRGATPVFADVRPDTLNLDVDHAESLITERTRLLVPVHYAGVACDMDALGAVAARHDLQVVEDNAHGLFGSYRGRPLGTLGTLSALSFHDTKNLTCGEGGALVVNDLHLRERAEVIADKGTDRAAFIRGQVRSYSWREIGSSYAPSELLAAVLLAQLEASSSVQHRRRVIWDRYHRELADWAGELAVQLPIVPPGCEPSYHLFHLVLPEAGWRVSLMEHLAAAGVASAWHYLPLHTSAMGTVFGGRAGDCPVAEDAAARLLRLPFYAALDEAETDRVIEAVTGWRPPG